MLNSPLSKCSLVLLVLCAMTHPYPVLLYCTLTHTLSSLYRQEQQQAQELSQVLEAARGFRRLHEAQAGIAARRAVQRAVHTLTRLGGALKGTLDVMTHAAVAGRLVNGLCEATAGVMLRHHMTIQCLLSCLQSGMR